MLFPSGQAAPRSMACNQKEFPAPLSSQSSPSQLPRSEGNLRSQEGRKAPRRTQEQEMGCASSLEILTHKPAFLT